MFIKSIKKLYRKPHVNPPFFRLTTKFKPLKFNSAFMFYSTPFFQFLQKKKTNNDNNNKLSELQGVKLTFFSDSHLAPKFFKMVAN